MAQLGGGWHHHRDLCDGDFQAYREGLDKPSELDEVEDDEEAEEGDEVGDDNEQRDAAHGMPRTLVMHCMIQTRAVVGMIQRRICADGAL